MHSQKTYMLLGIFFWFVGSVCAGPAIGADEFDQIDEIDSASQGGNPAAPSLFADDGDYDNSSNSQSDGIDDTDDADDDNLPNGQSVNVGDFGEISLHIKDLDLTKVLQLLSIQSQRNIIASRNVAGSISADLYNVDFYEAMDAILHANGFGYEEKGNFIYVYTAAELQTITDEARTMVTEVVRLNYINAADASTFVRSAMSSGGTIAVSGELTPGIQPTLNDAGGDSLASQGLLVIRDFPENIEEITQLLKELDVRPMQILIESTILTAKLTENNAFGIDFSIFSDVNIGDFTKPLDAVNQVISGAATPDSGSLVQSDVGNTAATGNGFKLGFFGSDFSVFVKALDSVTDTTVLAAPQLVVLNRQRADLLIGERLGYLSTTSTDTSTTQTVEFLDVGTQLSVRPTATNDGFVRLEVRPSISEGSTTVQAGAVIPTETTNEMISNVMVRSGQMVVMGGFFKESNQYDRKRIPGVGAIPIIGALGSGQDDTVSRDEVIFMIKPTILRDTMLATMGNSAVDGAQRAILGSRAGLLPWSSSKLTAAHLRDAHAYIAEGKNDKALWSVNMALNLDSTSVEASRLKEQLTGKTTRYSTDTILDQAIDAMIGAQVEAAIVPQVQTQATDVPADADQPPSDPIMPVVDAIDTGETEADTAQTTVQQSDEASLSPDDDQAQSDDDQTQSTEVADQAEPATEVAQQSQVEQVEQVEQIEQIEESIFTDIEAAAQPQDAEQSQAADWVTPDTDAQAQVDENLDIADFVGQEWSEQEADSADAQSNEQLSEVDASSVEEIK